MRRIGNFLLFLLIAVPVGTAYGQLRTVVEGRVVNRLAEDPGVITWNLCDPIGDDRLGMRLADDGRFRFVTDRITRLHNATLNYGEFINFFTAPGDSVWLEIDAARLRDGVADAVRFGGTHAEANSQLSATLDYLYGVRYRAPEPLDLDRDPAGVIGQVREQIGRCMDSLAAYEGRRGTPLLPMMKDFLARDLKFALANQLLDYKQDDPGQRLDLFGDPFFEVDDSANFCTMMYPYHLGAYMQTRISTDTAVIEAGKRGDFPTAARGGIRILLGEPATASRDVMLWKYLSHILQYNPALCDSVSEAEAAFLDPALGVKLATMGRRLAGVPAFPETPVKGVAYLAADSTLVSVPEEDMFAYLAAKYRGKVLYIDVYATWCGPCRAEMKVAPELHRLMEGREVVFVNLCLGSDQAAWRKMVGLYGIRGENYWFDRDATQLILGTYSLSGYPTYILVGKDGQIVTMKAGRPSDLTGTARQIESLL